MLDRPRGFTDVEVPTPCEDDLAAGDVIVRMLAGAICGSDLPSFRGVINLSHADAGTHAANIPGFPMHEIVGEVTASKSDLCIGDRVVGWAKNSNAIAEYVVSRAESTIAIGPAPAPVRQSIYQPLACVLHAVDRLGDVAGLRVAVIGQGPLGILFSHVLHSRGAARVVGVDCVDRSDFAAEFGVDEVVTTTSGRWSRSLAADEQPQLVIEAVGHQVSTLNHALDAVAHHGTVFYFGICDEPYYSVDMRTLQRRCLTLVSGVTPASGRHRRQALTAAGEYLRRHPSLAEVYFTDVFSLAEIETAYRRAENPAVGQLKVAVEWD